MSLAVENGGINLCRRLRQLIFSIIAFPQLALWATNKPPSLTAYPELTLNL
ncbi:MAG: hypothetical protein ACR2MG_14750 [Pyrinomonadaceae bacterium]